MPDNNTDSLPVVTNETKEKKEKKDTKEVKEINEVNEVIEVKAVKEAKDSKNTKEAKAKKKKAAPAKESVLDAVGKKEQKYDKVVTFFNSIRCMTICNDKADMYRKAANLFKEFAGYKDADDNIAACEALERETRNEVVKKVYDNAQYLKNKAKNADDYRVVGEVFKSVSGYLDADNMAIQCVEKSKDMDNKFIRKRLFGYVIGVVGFVALIFCLISPQAKYTLARGYEMIGSYESAMNIYGLLGSYKDSPDKMIEMEEIIINNSKPGDIVEFGKYQWTVLDAKENKALLMKNEPIHGSAYNEGTESSTWESSTLRKYLNEEFISKTFSEKERVELQSTKVMNNDNALYKTDGGNDTEDYIYILSMEEADKYKSVLPKLKEDSWLRSPGFNEKSAAFLTSSGKVMDYGYLVTSEEMNAYPVLWVQIK